MELAVEATTPEEAEKIALSYAGPHGLNLTLEWEDLQGSYPVRVGEKTIPQECEVWDTVCTLGQYLLERYLAGDKVVLFVLDSKSQQPGIHIPAGHTCGYVPETYLKLLGEACVDRNEPAGDPVWRWNGSGRIVTDCDDHTLVRLEAFIDEELWDKLVDGANT